MKLTNTVIQKHIKKGKGYIRDSLLTGFGVRIYPSGKAVYIVEPTYNGKCVRRVIGQYPLLSVSEARDIAKDKIKEITQPSLFSPVQITFKEAFKAYTSSVKLKPSTLIEYNRVFMLYLSDIQDEYIASVSEDMIVSMYTHSCKRSIGQANKSMKIVQAVFRWSGVGHSPVQILSRKRIYTHCKPRTGYIPLKDAPVFCKGLTTVSDPQKRLYIELLLHTGLRANEAMSITADSVKTGYLVITDTKNGTTHTLPITLWLDTHLIPFLNDYPDGWSFTICRKALKKACSFLPYNVTRHDLRRTFASYASEAGCDYLLIKRALNHSVSDITARYIQTSPSTLSPVFEAVAELIAEHRHS